MPNAPSPDRTLSTHILPTSGTMIGITTTLVGLVKVVETRTGPSHVDEFAGLASLLFLASAITSYTSLRNGGSPVAQRRLETLADRFFLVGLVAIVAIAGLFAYEVI